jgi:hypothetical protein
VGVVELGDATRSSAGRTSALRFRGRRFGASRAGGAADSRGTRCPCGRARASWLTVASSSSIVARSALYSVVATGQCGAAVAINHGCAITTLPSGRVSWK